MKRFSKNKNNINIDKNYFLIDNQNQDSSNQNNSDSKFVIFWAFDDNSTSSKNFKILNNTELHLFIRKFYQVEKLKQFLDNRENIRFFKEKHIALIISFQYACIISGILKSNFFIEKVFILFESDQEIDSLVKEFHLENFSDIVSVSAHTMKNSNIFPEKDINVIVDKLFNFFNITPKKNNQTSQNSLISIDLTDKQSKGSNTKKSKSEDKELYEGIDFLNNNIYDEMIESLDNVCQHYLEINFIIKLLENKENIEEAKIDFILFCEDRIKKSQSSFTAEDFNTFKAKITERRAENYSIIKFIANNLKFYTFFNKILINETFEDIFKIRYLIYLTKADLNNLKPRKQTINVLGSDNNIKRNTVDYKKIDSNEKENQKMFLYKKALLTKEDLKTINSCKNYPYLVKGFISSVDNLQYLIHSFSTMSYKKKINANDTKSFINQNNNEETTTLPSEYVKVIYFIELEGKVFNDKKFILEFDKNLNENGLKNGSSYKMKISDEDNNPINFEMKNYLILNNIFLIFNKVKISKSFHEVYCNLKHFSDIQNYFSSLVLSLEEKLNRITKKNYELDVFYVIEYANILQDFSKFEELLKKVSIKNEEQILDMVNSLCSSTSLNNSARRSISQDSNTSLLRSADYKNLIVKYYMWGLLKLSTDNHKEAIDYYDKALLIVDPLENKKIKLTQNDKDIYNYYSEIIANINFDLAKLNLNIFIDTKNFDKLDLAHEKIEKSLDKRSKIYNERSKEIADCLNLKGIIFKNSNQLDEALELYNLSMEIKKELYPEDSLEMTGIYNNIGNVLLKKKRLDEAMIIFNRALKICLKYYEHDNLDTADCYSNIGSVYFSKGENEVSIKNQKIALDMYLNILGKENSLTAIIYINLGLAYYAMGDYDNALINYENSLEIEKKTHGEFHPDTANCYNNLGNAYNNKKDYEKAIMCLQKCVEIRIETVGEDHTETANSFNNLGNVYLTMGDFDFALKYYTFSYNIKLKKNGENSADTACALNNIGLAYLRKDDFDQALNYFKKSFNIKLNTLGNDHPSTKRSKKNIEIVEKILEEIKNEEQE